MSRAVIRWISGPVLHARADGPFALREAVRVGPQALLGEVVRLDGDDIVVQVYEDTTGLRPGVEVTGDGQPLAIHLHPGDSAFEAVGIFHLDFVDRLSVPVA